MHSGVCGGFASVQSLSTIRSTKHPPVSFRILVAENGDRRVGLTRIWRKETRRGHGRAGRLRERNRRAYGGRGGGGPPRELDFRLKLSEKGASRCPGVDLAGFRGSKRAAWCTSGGSLDRVSGISRTIR